MNDRIQSNQKNKFIPQVKSKVLGKCESKVENIESIKENVLAKVPIILAQFTAEFILKFSLVFSYEINYIRKINSKLIIKQCILIPRTDVVFIKGFIREYIDYYTCYPSKILGAVGTLRHCFIDIPFELTVNIKFNINSPDQLVKSSLLNFNYLPEPIVPRKFNKKNVILPDNSIDKSSITTQHYNNFPYCQVIDSQIIQNKRNIITVTVPDTTKPLGIKEIKKVKNTMTILLRICILQDKYISISNS